MKTKQYQTVNPTKKGYRCQHGPGFVTRRVIEKDGKKIIQYKHRPGWNRKLATNNQRVVKDRAARMGLSLADYDQKYPSRWKMDLAYAEYLENQVMPLMAEYELEAGPGDTASGELPF